MKSFMERNFWFYEQKRMKTILLGVVFFGYYGTGLVDCSVSKAKVLQEDEKGKLLKRHAVKTFQTEDGDVIDCVDVSKQPAFDHPALKNHIIQMTPSYHPSTSTKKRSQASNDEDTKFAQIWKRSESCLKGTIPIRRTEKKDMRKPGPVHKDYSRKKKLSYDSISRDATQINDGKTPNLLEQNHSMSILFAVGYNYLGAKADISVWNPYVESDDEWSMSQIALINGPMDNFECVESGWVVNPGVYGDKKTRFFVYWTVDGSKKTGCFDLTCPGFVQTNHEIALGSVIYPVSTSTGLPYQITVYIYKDFETNNWWVQYGEEINIGYWPAELFRVLTTTASVAEWGGEVYSTKVGVTPHTSTQMGNGEFPDWVDQNCGSFKRIRILDNSLILKFPEFINTYTDEFRCYDVYYVSDYIEDPEFFYGGPGKNVLCP